MSIKLGGKLPDGDRNGLNVLGAELMAYPQHSHLIIALADVSALTTNVDTGAVTATLRVQRAEAILPGDRRDAWRLIERSIVGRTGEQQLPLGLDYDLEQLLRQQTVRHDDADRP